MKEKTISKCSVAEYFTTHKMVFQIEEDMVTDVSNKFEKNKFCRRGFDHRKLFYMIIMCKVNSITEFGDKLCYINYLIDNFSSMIDTPIADTFLTIFTGGLFGITLSDIINEHNNSNTICFIIFFTIATIIFVSVKSN